MKSNFAPPLSPTLNFRLIAFSLLTLAPAYSQTATYHLHREASPTAGRFQLNTPQPESAILAVQSAQLRNQGAGEYLIKEFDTAAANLPGIAGAIASGSTVSFLLWMRKTDTFGTLFPRAKLLVNSANGAQLCVATGSAALTTTLTPISLTCTTSSQAAMAVNDRFYLWVGTSMTAGPGNKALFAELDIEGTPGGNYDSLITVPLPVAAPAVSGLTPASGGVGTSVTIAGSGFGATQGSSTVTFNGTAATPTSWSASSIAAPVPSGVSTGPVVVRVGTLSSTGVTFTVQAGSVSGAVTRSLDSSPFSGVLVEALQGGLVMASGTSGGGGAFTIPGLGTGSYDVRATLNGYNQATNSNVAVTTGSTVTSNFSLVRGAPIQYVYDELNRLSAVLDRNGESARYRYDAVGNAAGIDRIGAGTVSILRGETGERGSRRGDYDSGHGIQRYNGPEHGVFQRYTRRRNFLDGQLSRGYRAGRGGVWPDHSDDAKRVSYFHAVRGCSGYHGERRVEWCSVAGKHSDSRPAGARHLLWQRGAEGGDFADGYRDYGK